MPEIDPGTLYLAQLRSPLSEPNVRPAFTVRPVDDPKAMDILTEDKKAQDFAKLKEEGNAAFKECEYERALSSYLSALKLTPDLSPERATILKNCAAAYLKRNEYDKVVDSCDKALEIIPDDPKALFRRCQALEHLERFEEAYRDARTIHKVDPGNKAVQPVLARLHALVEQRRIEHEKTENKVRQMFKYAFDLAEDMEKRTKAITNLLVLAKESYAVQPLIDSGIIEKIGQMLKVEKNHEIVVGCVRILGQLSKMGVAHTKKMISVLGIPWFLDLLNSKNEEHVNASQYCVQAILNSLSGIDKSKEEKPDEKLLQENKNEIDTLLTCLIYGCTSRTITGLARDAIIQLLSRNVHYRAINWAEQLIKIKGLQRLMEVASELMEYKYESAMEITESTRSITSVCLARIYENMYYDELRAKYMEGIEDFVKGKLITPELENKVRVVVAITTLLLGPIDAGNHLISKDGMMDMILGMASSEDVLQQKVACECIIAASTKKDKVRSIIAQGVNILKKLYQAKDDSIRVRALVGLCKLGSSGGTDASIRPFADGATTKLAEACKKFLINPKKDPDMRRWAAEGLSYLSLDADVKEKLINDKAAMTALFDLARSGNQNAAFGVVTTLVNLINAYDKQEILPELVELAKFAKHHIPQDHELDDPDFISQRCTLLVQQGVTSALVALAKTESDNCKEMISRIFNTLASQTDLRGALVQQGAVKALLGLAHKGTGKGMVQACQALSRIAISIDPEVAFPGQRCMEVIRPMLQLLHPDCAALENFEALLGLCNIASVSDATRKHIVKEGGVSKIENMMYEQHEMIRRAATQVMTNLITVPEVVKLYEGDNDRTKFLFLLCGEEDEETMKAAAGAMAMLTYTSQICCEKIFKVSSWLENFHMLLGSPNTEIQYRGVVIVNNIISKNKDLAANLLDTNILEILMALTLLEEESKAKIVKVAKEALKTAEKWKVIKPPGEEDED